MSFFMSVFSPSGLAFSIGVKFFLVHGLLLLLHERMSYQNENVPVCHSRDGIAR